MTPHTGRLTGMLRAIGGDTYLAGVLRDRQVIRIDDQSSLDDPHLAEPLLRRPIASWWCD